MLDVSFEADMTRCPLLHRKRTSAELVAACPLWAMCGQARSWQGFSHECSIGRVQPHVFGLLMRFT